MRVSIITPSYQQAQYLEETILSVLNQDYPDIEYWIMDGGSKDGSVEIIRKYESRLAGWLSEKDHGQADAINKGFARATGEIVAWINSDDYYMPGAISAAVNAMQSYPECGMVYGDVLAINGAGQAINLMKAAQWGLEDLMQFKILSQPAVFMRRSVLEKVGGLDLSYQYLLDNHLWLNMLRIASMYYVPQTWAAARYHSGAKNLSGGYKYGAEAYRLLDWMKTAPGLAEIYTKIAPQVMAGACCFDAHYLLDSGDAKGALKAYLRAMRFSPLSVVPHLKRMSYAALSQVINLEKVKSSYLERRKRNMARR